MSPFAKNHKSTALAKRSRERFVGDDEKSAVPASVFSDWSVPAKCGKILGMLIFGGALFGLSACSTVEDPEDPGFNEPAVSGVFRGEISSVKEYRDAVEKENRRAGRDGPRWNDGFNDEDFRN